MDLNLLLCQYCGRSGVAFYQDQGMKYIVCATHVGKVAEKFPVYPAALMDAKEHPGTLDARRAAISKPLKYIADLQSLQEQYYQSTLSRLQSYKDLFFSLISDSFSFSTHALQTAFSEVTQKLKSCEGEMLRFSTAEINAVSELTRKLWQLAADETGFTSVLFRAKVDVNLGAVLKAVHLHSGRRLGDSLQH